MEKKLMKYTLGIVYRKSSPWWNIDYLTSVLKSYNNLSVKLCEVSDKNNITIPNDLDIVALLPTESDVIVDFIDKNNGLKWIHCMWAGVDKFLKIKQITDNNNLVLTNARGAYAESLAEWVIFSMLYYSFNTPIYLNAYSEKKWIQPTNKLLKGKTLSIIGYGLNGVEIARKAKLGFDMNVIGIKKHINNVEGRQYLDEIYSVDKLDDILPQSDFIVNVLPQTDETVGMYNYEKFKLMKSSCIFINIGRGSSVVEEDLVRALNENIIYAAALDVTKTEPLPCSSPLFDLNNVLLSFHSCDNTDEYFNQGVEVFKKNLDSFLKDESLITVVDKKKGY